MTSKQQKQQRKQLEKRLHQQHRELKRRIENERLPESWVTAPTSKPR